MPDLRHLRRAAACAGALIALVATLLPAHAAVAAKPRFKAAVAYDTGACAKRGLNVFVSAKLPAGTTEEKADEIRKRFAPRGEGTLQVDGETYTLRPKRSEDFASTDNAAWFFGVVKVSAEVGEAVLGMRARVSYKTQAKGMSFTTKVARAACG